MKKLFIALLVGFVFVGVGYGLGSKYKYELYEMAMSVEKEKAKLSSGVLTVGDNEFSYLEGPKTEGQATLLLIHGFAANKENWLRFAANLTDQYHVTAADL